MSTNTLPRSNDPKPSARWWGKLRNSIGSSHVFTATLETRLPDLLSRIEDLGTRFTVEVYFSSLPVSSFPEQQPVNDLSGFDFSVCPRSLKSGRVARLQTVPVLPHLRIEKF